MHRVQRQLLVLARRLVQCETPSPTIWSRWVQRSGCSRRAVESAEVVVVVVPQRVHVLGAVFAFFVERDMHRFRIGFFRPKVGLKGSQPLLEVRNAAKRE